MSQEELALPCPACGYDLRALSAEGDALRCPECGGSTDRAAIQAEIERLRRRPSVWYLTLAIIWNTALATMFVFVSWRIVLKLSFQHIDMDWPASFLAAAIFVQLTGIGLLIALGLFLLSLCTLFWRPVHRRWRWFYAFATLVFLLGTADGTIIDWWDMGIVQVNREFIFFLLVMAFPIVVFGTGYLGLPHMLWTAVKRRKRKRRTAPSVS